VATQETDMPGYARIYANLMGKTSNTKANKNTAHCCPLFIAYIRRAMTMK